MRCKIVHEAMLEQLRRDTRTKALLRKLGQTTGLFQAADRIKRADQAKRQNRRAARVAERQVAVGAFVTTMEQLLPQHGQVIHEGIAAHIRALFGGPVYALEYMLCIELIRVLWTRTDRRVQLSFNLIDPPAVALPPLERRLDEYSQEFEQRLREMQAALQKCRAPIPRGRSSKQAGEHLRHYASWLYRHLCCRISILQLALEYHRTHAPTINCSNPRHDCREINHGIKEAAKYLANPSSGVRPVFK